MVSKFQHRTMLLFAALIVVVTVAALTLSACADDVKDPSGIGVPNGLFATASLEASVLSFYYFDGYSTHRSYIDDVEVIQEVLERLESVNVIVAPSLPLEHIGVPIFGLEIDDIWGGTLSFAWANEYWIFHDGPVFFHDFDFAQLRFNYPWIEKDELPGFAIPNMDFLAEDRDWNTDPLPSGAENIIP